MKARMRAIWLGAVGIGGAFGAALWTSMQLAEPPMGCAEWAENAATLSAADARHVFYVARRQGTTLPDSLGTCAGGTCTIKPDNCADGIEYEIKTSPWVTVAANQWQVVRIEAHPKVAGRLRAFADSEPGVRWLGTFTDATAECRTTMTAAQCRDMFVDIEDCWALATGDVCRYGQLVRVNTPGDPSPLACPALAANDKPFPCTVARGAGSEWDDLNRAWTVEELE